MHSAFANRRAKLSAMLEPNALVILSSGSSVIRNGNVAYPYRPRSDFYYLTGFTEPDAVLLIYKQSGIVRSILFNQTQDPEMALWSGDVIGQIGACRDYGFDEAYSIHALSARLPHYLEKITDVYWLIEEDNEIQSLLETMIDNQASPCELMHRWSNLSDYLQRLRSIKQPIEIEALRQAAKISARAHRRAMQTCQPGQYEYHVEAELLHEFYRSESRYPAYPSIVAGGENACILHYQHNQAQLKEGDLLLIDAGCEYQYYASDISRTFPINGKFTPPQRKLYEIVLKAQLAVIAAIRPGISWDTLENIAHEILIEELISLGLISAESSQLIQQQAIRDFYPHRIGHDLGLDVHDHSQDILQAGMVITIEPGLYIQPQREDVAPLWRGIGIRIEDDILVTETGCEVLSSEVPKTIEEIEAIMNG